MSTETFDILAVALTLWGMALSAVFTVFIFLGKKIQGGEGVQRVSYKGVEIRTNSVVTILIASLALAVAPLLMSSAYRLFPSTGEKQNNLYITGQVLSTDNEKLTDAVIQAKNLTTKKEDESKSDQNGSFTLGLLKFKKPGDSIEFVAKKNGYLDQKITLGTEMFNISPILLPSKKTE